MSILEAVIAPHPPLTIPTVGRGQERKVQATINAYRTAAKQAAVWEPEVLIITSPHQIMYADYFHISPGKGATGDMSTWNGKLAEIWTLLSTRPETSRAGRVVCDLPSFQKARLCLTSGLCLLFAGCKATQTQKFPRDKGCVRSPFEVSVKKYPAWLVQFICSYGSSDPNGQLHLHKKIFVIK